MNNKKCKKQFKDNCLKNNIIKGKALVAQLVRALVL